MQQQQMPQPQFTFEGGHLVMFHQEVTGLSMKDPNVNDKDRMQDLLAQTKYLSNNYDIAMNEASHDALFQVYKQNHSNIKDLERQLFTAMFKKGWYRLPVADAQSVADAFQKAQKLQSQLPFPTQMQSATGTRAPSMTMTQAMQQAKTQGQTANTTTNHMPTQTGSQMGAGSTMGAGSQATGGGTQTTQQAGSSQQLNQVVDKAIQQAQHGQVPAGFPAGH